MPTIFKSDAVEINNEVINKALVIKLSGFAPKDKAKDFIGLYNHAVSQVQTDKTTLIIDSTELKTFAPEILPVLEQSYKLYMSSGFKEVVMVCPQEIVATSQLKRVGRSVSFTGVFVNSKEEAVNISKSN